jgi:drug/metabolite transporter (DMT)-like permease
LDRIYGSISHIFFVYAVSRISLSEMNSILYLSPICVLLSGVIIMGDKLVLLDICTCFFSFLGTLMVIKPPFIARIFTDN